MNKMSIDQQENNTVILKQASTSDIPTLIQIESSIEKSNVYSAMLSVEEWREELHNGKVFLIIKNDIVVGDVSYQEENTNTVYISGLVIMPSFQGKGIAREVLTKLLIEFQYIKKITLVTHPDNHAALHLYKSLGFTIESIKDDYYGDGEPRLLLSKTN